MPPPDPTDPYATPEQRGGWRYSPWFLLAVLTAVNTVNWADRQVVPILVPAIGEELMLTDAQLGVMGSLAFAAIYAISAFPFGYGADRWIRRNLIAFGLVVWSIATAASGMATGFGSLIAARFFTGIGEASLYPCAMSLIAQRFPALSRGRAMGIFGAAAAVGGGLGIAAGGALSTALGWRSVFTIYGIGGLFLLPLLLSVPEERRPAPKGEDADTLGAMGRLISDPRLLLTWTSGALMIASGIGYAFWMPTYLVRYRGFDVSTAALLMGAAQLVGGLGGALLGGVLADRRRRKRGVGGELDVPIVAGIVAAPLAAITLVTTWEPLLWATTILAPMAILAYFPAIQTVIVGVAPPRQHGIAYAINILFLAGLGQGLGPTLLGVASDLLGELRPAMVFPLGGMLTAALVMWLAQRRIMRGVAEADVEPASEPVQG